MHVSEIVVRKSRNERFTVNERLAMLVEWEACLEPGQKSALCRRLGIDPKSPRRWAQAKRDGLLEPSDLRSLNRAMSKRERADLVRLTRENEALKRKLAQSESAVEVLGKASELLTALAKSSRLQTPPEPTMPPEVIVPKAYRARPRRPSDSTPSSGWSAPE